MGDTLASQCVSEWSTWIHPSLEIEGRAEIYLQDVIDNVVSSLRVILVKSPIVDAWVDKSYAPLVLY